MSTDNPAIHRLLDEAFVGIELTPDVQDLKEEIRGNLAARASELQANGADAATAARTAVHELGSIRALVDDLGPAASMTVAELFQHYRVKPKPGFVVRTVLLSLVLAAGVVLVTLGAFGVIGLTLAAIAGAIGAAALGVLVADSLRQEKTQSYALPTGRSALYGVTTFVGMTGISLVALLFGNLGSLWLLIVGSLLVLASLIGFIVLGVTQTNVKKAWALAMERTQTPEDRFSQDPAAAARFGLYTVVIWTLAIVAFVVLSMTVGFAWSWLAIVAGFVVFFLVLARSLFPAK